MSEATQNLLMNCDQSLFRTLEREHASRKAWSFFAITLLSLVSVFIATA